MSRFQNETMAERVMRSVMPEPNTGCWLWNGRNTLHYGYGVSTWKGKLITAHRLSHLAFLGPIPADKPFVLHRCDTPACVNPDHLYAGTPADNNADCVRHGRHTCGPKLQTVCKYGHEFSRRGDGRRYCRVCADNRRREKSLSLVPPSDP